MNNPFPQPPLTSNHAGDERRVGIEIEFTNLPGTSIARIVKDVLRGTVEWETDYEAVVRDTNLGNFIVELDWRWLKEQQQNRNGLPSKSPIADQAIDLIGIAAQQLVPWEIVSPPIPITQLHRLDELVAVLHNCGGTGCRLNIWHRIHNDCGRYVPDTEPISSGFRAPQTMPGPRNANNGW